MHGVGASGEPAGVTESGWQRPSLSRSVVCDGWVATGRARPGGPKKESAMPRSGVPPEARLGKHIQKHHVYLQTTGCVTAQATFNFSKVLGKRIAPSANLCSLFVNFVNTSCTCVCWAVI